MQILFVLLLLLILVAFIIFKIRHKFKIKELMIFLSLVVAIPLGIYIYMQKQENIIPNLFKAKYEKTHKSKIIKFSSERVNDIYLSSDKTFVYNFNYIIEKNNVEYVCFAKNIKILKIEDEYIFDNFEKINEECKKK